MRKAFELAIDRTALIHVVYNGLFTPTAQAVPPASPFYAQDVVPPARDVAKAKRLLQQAGVKLPVTVNLMVANAPDQVQTGEVIQSMAAEAGFDVKIQAMEFASSLDMSDRGDFEAYLIGWSGRTDPDGNIWSFMHTGGPLNAGHYSNKDVDGWLDQARLTTDTNQRVISIARWRNRTRRMRHGLSVREQVHRRHGEERGRVPSGARWARAPARDDDVEVISSRQPLRVRA